jgi:hypothetical protein
MLGRLTGDAVIKPRPDDLTTGADLNHDLKVSLEYWPMIRARTDPYKWCRKPLGLPGPRPAFTGSRGDGACGHPAEVSKEIGRSTSRRRAWLTVA